MKRTMALILCVFTFAGLTACRDTETEESSDYDVDVSQTSDGTLIIGDASETSTEEVSQRNLNEAEVSASDGSISFDEAVELLQSCQSTDMYLPDSPSEYEAFYVETTTINDIECYRIDLYLNVNSVPMFVGVPYAVSCDGQYVLEKTIVGSWSIIEPVSAEEQEDYLTIYDSPSFSPNEAIESVEKLTLEQVGIENELTDYYLRFEKTLYTVVDDECYRISVTAYTSSGVQIAAFIFVSASSGTIYKTDPDDNSQYIILQAE